MPLEKLIDQKIKEKLTASLERHKSWFKISHISDRGIDSARREFQPKKSMIQTLRDHASGLVPSTLKKILGKDNSRSR